MWVLVGTAIAAVGVDQLTKAVAVAALGSGPAHIGVLHLRLVANRGLLMGILPAPLVVVAAATLLVVWFAVRAGRTGAIRTSIAFGLLAGGALGNFVDRILERQAFPGNAVVDWLSFGGMTFNLADVALLVGALMLVFGHESVPDKPTV
jgi:signal peptidase II